MSGRQDDTNDEFAQARAEAAAQKEKDERAATMFGLGLMGLGGVTVSVPIIMQGTIGAVPALAGLAIAILGGLLRDPKTFKSIATRAIDALPGGKN